MHLTTFTVALGDARYYVRKMFQDILYPTGHEAAGEANSPAMALEEDNFRAAIEQLSLGKVIGVSRGVFYDDSAIPDGTSGKDDQINLLIKFGTGQDAPVRLVTIPQLDDSVSVNEWFADNKATILDSDGTPASELVGKNIKVMRRARGTI